MEKEGDAHQMYQLFDGLEALGKETQVLDALPTEVLIVLGGVGYGFFCYI